MAAPLFLQWTYAKRLNNGSLRNFKVLSNRIVCSCIYCGDSATDKFKARGNIYQYKSTLLYSCYNCGIALPFEKFLKDNNEPLYKEFKLETLKGQSITNKSPVAEDILKSKVVIKDKNWKSVFTTPKGDALKYIKSRQIPFPNDILYTDNFKRSMVDLYELFEIDLDELSPCREEARIVFPFVVNNVLTFVQGRSIDPSIAKAYRYMTMEVNSGHKVYGYDRVNKNETVYVTEGPIDSLFVSNGIAVADANLTRAGQVIDKSNLCLIFDNEPRSSVAIGKMTNALLQGYSIVIFPDYIEEKDLNEMNLVGRDVQNIVDSYQYSGPTGLLKLKQWSRV